MKKILFVSIILIFLSSCEKVKYDFCACYIPCKGVDMIAARPHYYICAKCAAHGNIMEIVPVDSQTYARQVLGIYANIGDGCPNLN